MSVLPRITSSFRLLRPVTAKCSSAKSLKPGSCQRQLSVTSIAMAGKEVVVDLRYVYTKSPI